MAPLPRAALTPCLLLLAACGGGNGDPPDPAAAPAAVSIVAPEDGATVQGTFPVELTAEGLRIEPAGAAVEGAGHFHLMVDTGCLPAGEAIPADDTHLHLEDGASDTELTLAVGEHTLCLQAGDGLHAALEPTDEITVTVAGGETTPPEEGEALEDWEGTYEGQVVWDCGPAGRRRGALSADVVVFTWPGGLASLHARHTVTGSCAGTGALTSRIDIENGERTPDGFRFPSTVWGVPGSFTLEVTGTTAAGRLTGPVPGPGRIAIDFDLACAAGC